MRIIYNKRNREILKRLASMSTSEQGAAILKITMHLNKGAKSWNRKWARHIASPGASTAKG